MARCGCGTNSIAAGDCVTISGLGSAASPYVVSVKLDPAGGITCGPDGLAAGAPPAPPTPQPDPLAVFAIPDAAVVAPGKGRFRFPYPARIIGVSAASGTAPTGAALILDVNKNGSTIFTTPANRPTFASGSNEAPETTPDVTTLATGDYLTVDVDQVGITVPGSDLTVFVRYTSP